MIAVSIVTALLTTRQVSALTGICFTSSRQINALVTLENGEIAAATQGGVLILRGTKAKKLTRAEGLASNEVQGFEPGKDLVAITKVGKTRFPFTVNESPSWTATAGQVTLAGAKLPSKFEPTLVRGVTNWKGTPIAAVLGFGLRQFKGGKWEPLPKSDPLGPSVSCVAAGKKLTVGTIDRGVWELGEDGWKRATVDREIPDHNIQTLSTTRARIIVGGMDGRPYMIDPTSLKVGEMAQTFPRLRGVMEAEGTRILRYADGRLQAWRHIPEVGVGAGEEVFLPWSTGQNASPIKWASCLSSDSWSGLIGGESQFFSQDGDGGLIRYAPKELKGETITALAGNWRWYAIGTQRKGLGFYNPKDQKLVWVRSKRPETAQWITHVSSFADIVYAGTFNGHLLAHVTDRDPWDRSKTPWDPMDFRRMSDIDLGDGSPVVGIKYNYVATRKGVYILNVRDKVVRPDNLNLPVSEIQSLEERDGWLWVGTRTGLYAFKLITQPDQQQVSIQ